MGASGWQYYVPYQADLQAALDQLREETFANGAYYWPHRDGPGSRPRPATMAGLFADDWVRQSGTHSILDVSVVLDPGMPPTHGSIRPVTVQEAIRYAATDRLTRAHFGVVDLLAMHGRRWYGRCAVFHDEAGDSTEIYFSGVSGD